MGLPGDWLFPAWASEAEPKRKTVLPSEVSALSSITLVTEVLLIQISDICIFPTAKSAAAEQH